MVSLQLFDPKGLIHTVSSEQLMLRCVCYLNSEAFIWATISEAGNSNELMLCSRSNSGSSISVAVLMRASFIKALDGFSDCTFFTFLEKVIYIFRIDRPSCHKLMIDRSFSLLIKAVLGIIWTLSFTKIGQSSVYPHPTPTLSQHN